MHPVLFSIPLFGGINIYTYGVLVATGFLAGIFWVTHETRRLHLDTGKALDLIFYIIVAAIIGSRLMFLIINDPGRLLRTPWSVFMIWEGGLVFFGGLLASIITSVIYFWRKKMRPLVYVDVFAPAIALGHAFGRIGCFMAGCCHGKPSGDFWLSITFPESANSLAPAGLPLYPTQLIEAAGNFLVFATLVLFRKHKKFDGQVFAFYLIIYSILRFLVELLRGDADRGYIIKGIISTSQGVSMFLFLCGVLLLVWGYLRGRKINE